jgi:Ca-activated chloride channel family protein
MVGQLRQEFGGPGAILRTPRALEALALGFLLMALAQPVYPEVLNRLELKGLQFMLVLDLSLSMEKEGLGPGAVVLKAQTAPVAPGAMAPPGSKMEAIKKSALEFIRRRKNDEFGLVVFSNNGYLAAPLTFDHQNISQYLRRIRVDSIQNEGFTAIGEGLGTANDYFDYDRQISRRSRAKGNVIILLTDGDHNFGRDPILELRRARSEGTHVYYMGVGLQRESALWLSSAVPITGGKYFDVREPQHLDQAFAQINQIEKAVLYKLQLKREQPAYFIFVVLSIVCLAFRMLLHAVPPFIDLT